MIQGVLQSKWTWLSLLGRICFEIDSKKGSKRFLAWLHCHANGHTTRKSLAFRKTQQRKIIKSTKVEKE